MKSIHINARLIVLFLGAVSIGFSQDLPADFGDIIDENPNDVSLNNPFWMAIVCGTIFIYLIREKLNKRLQKQSCCKKMNEC